tara:strand:+ start:407 stop:634 length:228 start_codon:yes stop_codon:yes gene_type:complete
VAKVKNPTGAFVILSLLAFSVLGATVADGFDKRDIEFPSVSRTIVLGVVGAVVFERTLQSTGAASPPVVTPLQVL